MSDATFGIEHRLRRRSDFKRIFSHQNKAAGKYVVVMVSRHGKRYRGPGRLGVVVSTKVSKRAVRRHQLKRWVKELFRTQLKAALYGQDLVVLFRRDLPTDDGESHQKLNDEILRLLPKAQQQSDNYKKRKQS